MDKILVLQNEKNRIERVIGKITKCVAKAEEMSNQFTTTNNDVFEKIIEAINTMKTEQHDFRGVHTNDFQEKLEKVLEDIPKIGTAFKSVLSSLIARRTAIDAELAILYAESAKSSTDINSNKGTRNKWNMEVS